jgi:hypothetical protein
MGSNLDDSVREVVDRLATSYEHRSNLWEQSGRADLVPTDNLDAVVNLTGSSKAQVCDAVAKDLAFRFTYRTLTFDFCDDLVNDVCAWITEDLSNNPTPLGGYPNLFIRIFEAFEEGEFIHPGDSPDIDAAEKYARPLIAAVVRDLSHD